MMRRLTGIPEHLDGTLANPAVLDGNLRDLARVNRRFGGTRLSVDALRRLVTREAAGRGALDVLRVLDVGTGAADIPASLADAPGPWRSVHVTAVDSRPEVVAAARRVNSRLAGRTAVALSVADGRALPFGDDAFDVAHASLVLHHLDRDEAVRFLRELGRVAKLGVVVNDLARGMSAWIGAWLVLHAMTRNAYTLHDGPLSVRRAWTRGEARGLLDAAGLRATDEFVGFAGHRWAIAAVRR